jgi:hypothetical protein
VVFLHPDTAAVTYAQLKSNDFSTESKDGYETPFKVGDAASAVYLPGRLEKTLRLYAFLELSPDVNLRSPAKPDEGSPLKKALVMASVPALFVVLFANVYAFGRYEPLDFDWRRAAIPLAAGALLLGGGLFAGLYLPHRAEQERIRRRAQTTRAQGGAVEVETPFLGQGVQGWLVLVVVAVSVALLGALTALSWSFMANAWLDRSPSRDVPAAVVEMTMTTHAFVFREYELEYRLDGASKTRKLLTTPEHLYSFEGDRAVARVRQGRFGWPWVETVESAPAP